jgi:hypothetical protein
LAYADVVDVSGRKVPDQLTVRAAAQVLVAQEQADTAGPGEPFGNRGKVFTDILSRRPFVEARVLARLIDSIVAQGQ